MRSYLPRLLLVSLSLAVFATTTSAQDLPLKDLLIEGENWKLVAEGYQFTEGPAADAEGNLYFVDVPASKIFRLDVTSGKVSEFVAESGKASGLAFGGDGRLYACQNGARAVVAYDKDGKPTTICSDVDVNDLTVTRDNRIYWTDPKNKQVWTSDAQGNKRVVDTGIARPNGITLWPDQRTLVVADSGSDKLWAFRIAADGSLEFKQPYYTCQLPSGKTESSADGLTVDAVGRVYAATNAGLQVFDTQGRLSGVIASPQPKFLSNVKFAGPNLDTLYVTCSDKVYSRRVQAKGVARK